MTFQQNRTTYMKKCRVLSQKMIQLGVVFEKLALSIQQHGITDDTRKFIDKQTEIFTRLSEVKR